MDPAPTDTRASLTRHTKLSDENIRQFFARNPRYELKAHLCHIVRKLIANGVLIVGDSVPSIIHLAKVLNLHESSVAYAYVQLTKEGTLRGIRGSAIYVVNPTPAREHLANDTVMDAIVFCQQIGLNENEARAIIEDQITKAFEPRAKGTLRRKRLL
jgi:DNA-binding transcriptional regulator YhcF (GntR family)